MAHVDLKRERRAFLPLSTDAFDVQVRAAAHSSIPTPARLCDAIEHDELSLYYQPQYNVRGGRHCGVEALARWFLPNGGSIAPLVFVPSRKGTGRSPRSARGYSRRHARPWRPGVVAAKSRRYVRQRLAAADHPGVLSVLPTNSSGPASGGATRTGNHRRNSHRQTRAGAHCLAQWKRLGVRIALDDFGAGYSSLSYLSRLPVDRVKIDKSLIHRMTADAKTAAIVRSVISLGADFGFAVLAEGVETEVQLTMLRRMGCQQVQGYLLALPACADQARAMLASNWGTRPLPHSHPAAHSPLPELQCVLNAVIQYRCAKN